MKRVAKARAKKAKPKEPADGWGTVRLYGDQARRLASYARLEGLVIAEVYSLYCDAVIHHLLSEKASDQSKITGTK